jgi:hypothetical protein
VWTNCAKNLKYETQRIVSALLCVTCGQTDGQRDVASLRVTFLNSFANAPENRAYLLMALRFYDVIKRNISDCADAS